MGRPTDYTPELASRICGLIAGGAKKPKSIRKIVKIDGMPSEWTIYKWLRDHEEFSQQYARAREMQSDWYAENAITVAEKAKDAQLARLKVDTYKWAAGQLNCQKWGPKKIVDDGPQRAARKATSDERLARICELAVKHGPGSASGVSGDVTPSEGSDEFSVLRQSH